jgi:translocation and assembly module TamA
MLAAPPPANAFPCVGNRRSFCKDLCDGPVCPQYEAYKTSYFAKGFAGSRPVATNEDSKRTMDLSEANRAIIGFAVAVALAVALVPLPSLAVDKVVFSVDSDDAATRAALETASLLFARQNDPTADPRDVLAEARADYGRLMSALYREGYYGGIIHIWINGREAAGYPPFEAPAHIGNVQIDVATGPRFRFGTARVAPLPAGTVIVNDFRSGAIARSSTIVDATNDAVAAWRDVGRAKAELAGQSIVADHRDATLDADITLSPGPEVRFGSLVQTTPSAVRSERIARIAGLPTGTRFSPQALDDTAERLRRTGAFSSVALTEADSLGSGNTMDIGLALVDEKPRRFGFGVEWSNMQGASVSGFWLHRNLFGGAERLRIDGEVTGIDGTIAGMDATLTARLDIPAAFTTDTDAYVLLEGEYRDDPGYTLLQGGGEVGVHRRFSSQLEGEAGLAYHYAITTDDLGTRRFSFASVPASITWDRRDDPLDPTTGTFLLADVEPFYEFTGSTAGARGWIDARGYFGMADDRLVLAGRVQLGYVAGAGAGAAAVPTDYLFYSGGADTVRGFAYQSLGADLGGGDTIGGHAFLGASTEVRFKATDKIGVVAFADIGHIGANTFFDGGGGWQLGAGVGLRYDTGIGPVRLDVAMPVMGQGGGTPQIYLGIGQSF